MRQSPRGRRILRLQVIIGMIAVGTLLGMLDFGQAWRVSVRMKVGWCGGGVDSMVVTRAGMCFVRCSPGSCDRKKGL
jgi:hypothetical protein